MTHLLPRISSILALFACAISARGDVILRVDLNDSVDFPEDTAPAFTAYSLGDESLTIGSFSLDVNPASGAALDDFRRATPADSGALTLAALYRDGVFSSGTTSANFYRIGLDTQISGLTPGKRYAVTAWSSDSSATGVRISDWSMLGLGGPQFAVNNYSFDGAVAPASDTANRFVVTAYADANGRLTLRGRQNAATATPQIFLNGVMVDEQADAAVQATTVLALEFNDRAATGASNTLAGFSEFLLSGGEGTASSTTTVTYGPHTATLTGVGSTMDDRARATPIDSGGFNESNLYRGFVFTGSTVVGNGLDLRIQGLTPNQAYLAEVWSHDSGSGGMRTSDWTVNGATLWDDYVFNGNNVPVTNDDYKMAGRFTATAAGELVISGRVAVSVSGAPAVFLNAARISKLEAVPIVDLGRPIISEFLAANKTGVSDEDDDASDWIEIWNTTASPLNLEGWHLTDLADAPGLWTFPAGVVVPSQGRLRVWASGKNRVSNPAALHTNFGLQREAGGYLALTRPDGTVASSFTNIPQQDEDTSYGVSGTADPLIEGYFRPPTPGTPNGSSVPGFVADTTFDFDRGFYSAPFNVRVTCATPNAQIFYTTDGSEPTMSSMPYPGAAGIPIKTTTVLRAKAFAPPLSPSNTDTQTYIFKAQVQAQPANPAGWPFTWGIDSEVDTNDGAGDGTVPANYAMDSDVVNTTLSGYAVSDALGALPTLSVVLPPADFLGGTGMYSNPRTAGDAWERACSLELIEVDGSGFHTNAGIRVHGNSSRRPFRMQKHGFRIAFRAEYGDGRLGYKLFDDTTGSRFNKLILHGFFTDGWGLVSWDAGRYRPETALGMRDAFMKTTFAEMGHARVSGRYAHVYINGLYWGIYRIGERVEDDWCAEHFGGAAEDWDVIAFGETNYARGGTAAAWDSFFALVNASDLSVQANYQAVANLLDLENFADYYLLHAHGDSEDWPHHNGYAIRNRVAAGAKWRFVTWDQELAFDPLVNVNRYGNTATKTPGQLLQKLRVNPEFRLLFADRAHKHLNNTGALSVPKAQARWQSIADLLDKGIVAESARWGDTADETPYGNAVPAGQVLKRETHWLPQMQLVRDSHIPGLHNRANAYATITELIAQNLWPATEPPEFEQFGGNVAVGYTLPISAASGAIYYTLNGSDPREAFTGNAVGTLYSGPVALAATCTVKARALNAGVWSPLTEATFIVGIAASSANLAVTELFYDPLDSGHEFVELMNFSASTIDLTDVTFEGLTFQFTDGTLLSPGERLVVARNSAAFVARYGNVPRLAGQYAGALDNNGETIAVIAANGADIVRFHFEDGGAWPDTPAGGTRAIVLRSTTVAATDPANWRLSANPGGSPGDTDRVAFTGSPHLDEDQDGLVALLEYALGTSDSAHTPSSGTVAAIEQFSIGGVPTPFLTLTAILAAAADDARVHADLSSSLPDWDASAASVVYLGETMGMGGRVIRKWRAAQPVTPGAPGQFFRLRVEMP